MTLADPEAPWTVKAAALLMVVFAVTEIVMALGRGGAVRIPAKAITCFGDGDRSSERSDERLCVVQPPWHIVPAS